jgi:Raf kinase inhibitor-like YbhB/YbcL family protein
MNKRLLIALLLLLYQGGVMAFTLTSSAFAAGKEIPKIYTCDGGDISPPLQWQDAPTGTQTFALIVDDPDAPAGTWDHWIIFNIPKLTTHFPEHLTKLPQGALAGKNSWDKTNYGGPCPPSGQHRYVFTLYALNAALTLPVGASKAQIEVAAKEHMLAKTQLIGVYQRE